MPNLHDLKALSEAQYDRPVLSVYVRTDPRDQPGGSRPHPWEIELRNALRSIGDRLATEEASREDQQAFAGLRTQVERELALLGPNDRGRSVAWFVGAGGDDILRLNGLQVPVQRTCAVWDERPFIAPLVDIVDRGAPTGAVLVCGNRVRLLEAAGGSVTEPDNASYELELGDWRPYGGHASANPARGQQTVSHQERYDARVDDHRGKMFDQAAHAIAQRADTLGWERVVIVSEDQYAKAFRAALPDTLERKIVATVDHNVGHEDLPTIAGVLEPVLEDVWRTRATRAVADAQAHARSGNGGAIGADETLHALAEGRVDHLILDPGHDFGGVRVGPAADTSEASPELVAERAIEAALGAGGRVSALPVADCDALRDAGGMVALLRY